MLKNGKIVSKLPCLMACKEMSAANHITVTRLFNEGMHLLCPKGVGFYYQCGGAYEESRAYSFMSAI